MNLPKKRENMPAIRVRPLEAGESVLCEAIMRALPQWFGIEESIVEYRKATEKMETYLSEIDGEVTGFISLDKHTAFSAEIHVLAVRAEFHGAGHGRALVEHLEHHLRKTSVEFFQVKTLGASHPDLFYKRTRGFYRAMGFRELEETNLWGEHNPCLIMVKHLPSAPSL